MGFPELHSAAIRSLAGPEAAVSGPGCGVEKSTNGTEGTVTAVSGPVFVHSVADAVWLTPPTARIAAAANTPAAIGPRRADIAFAPSARHTGPNLRLRGDSRGRSSPQKAV